jgi:diguanylate cyclase (GGDEF)-like protein
MITINTVKDPHGQVDHYVAFFSDITEKKKAEDLILEQANYDPITRLSNRRMFQDRLHQEIIRSRRSGHPFALLFIDLDYFKGINDTFGHDLGDQLLRKAAERIVSQVRDSDTVSRIGGDEFTVILPEFGEIIHIDHIANKIIAALSEEYRLENHHTFISASIGISIYPYDAETTSDLIKHSDQAMYLAKQSGRSRSCYFTPSMQQEAEKRQSTFNDLREALSADQFELFYQPIIELSSGKIFKAEALVRWRHPQRGLICPDDFIPVAEESGLIVPLGQKILDTALRQTATWKATLANNLQISINISPIQFRAREAMQHSIQDYHGSGLLGRHTIIEITESTLMGAHDEMQKMLRQLRDMGVEIALDDFGTGYSSLAYLKEFDIDYIKIDKSFIKALKPDSSEIAMCESMIVMAKKLGIRTIAEGIETAEQQDLLKSMGCDFAQGFLYAKPIPVQDFEVYFKAKNRVDI